MVHLKLRGSEYLIMSLPKRKYYWQSCSLVPQHVSLVQQDSLLNLIIIKEGVEATLGTNVIVVLICTHLFSLSMWQHQFVSQERNWMKRLIADKSCSHPPGIQMRRARLGFSERKIKWGSRDMQTFQQTQSILEGNGNPDFRILCFLIIV